MSGAAPGRFACWLVTLTVRTLPHGARARYRTELLADLYGLGRPRQLGEAASLLLHCGALRAAASPTNAEEAIVTVLPHKPLLCYLHHALHTVVTEDGTTIRCCKRCGEEHYDGENNRAGAYIGNWIAGPPPM